MYEMRWCDKLWLGGPIKASFAENDVDKSMPLLVDRGEDKPKTFYIMCIMYTSMNQESHSQLIGVVF